mmetsp:Transcript_72448/g.151207  ORF Transcript_72448/g.151207 Transcript_72448/m.151207 type:complete len:317 (+) Transcript_72448:771-1721(+)
MIPQSCCKTLLRWCVLVDRPESHQQLTYHEKPETWILQLHGKSLGPWGEAKRCRLGGCPSLGPSRMHWVLEEELDHGRGRVMESLPRNSGVEDTLRSLQIFLQRPEAPVEVVVYSRVIQDTRVFLLFRILVRLDRLPRLPFLVDLDWSRCSLFENIHGVLLFVQVICLDKVRSFRFLVVGNGLVIHWQKLLQKKGDIRTKRSMDTVAKPARQVLQDSRQTQVQCAVWANAELGDEGFPLLQSPVRQFGFGRLRGLLLFFLSRFRLLFASFFILAFIRLLLRLSLFLTFLLLFLLFLGVFLFGIELSQPSLSEAYVG